jgi:hypothetical protein
MQASAPLTREHTRLRNSTRTEAATDLGGLSASAFRQITLRLAFTEAESRRIVGARCGRMTHEANVSTRSQRFEKLSILSLRCAHATNAEHEPDG